MFQRAPNSVSVSIGLWLKTGSRHETDLERGYSHFLEHMLFKGTEKRTAKEQAQDIERVGGDSKCGYFAGIYIFLYNFDQGPSRVRF